MRDNPMIHLKGTVFDIQKCSVHDGPGIRTTVFLKGCPLDCLWCHNPESKFPKPQLMLYTAKCIGCGECVLACPDGLHAFSADGTHLIDRKHCLRCGKCETVCTGALHLCGRKMSVDEVMTEVLKDKLFYDNSGGGITLSGGEPLMQAEFALALLTEAKRHELHTAIETSGFAKWETLKAFAEVVDLFLWDVKETDSEQHKTFTGVGNELILDNLERLNALGAKVILRCPIIPGCNDREEHLANIGRLAERLSCVDHIDVEPYHPLGKGKASALGRQYPLETLASPTEETITYWCDTLSHYTTKPVVNQSNKKSVR